MIERFVPTHWIWWLRMGFHVTLGYVIGLTVFAVMMGLGGLSLFALYVSLGGGDVLVQWSERTSAALVFLVFLATLVAIVAALSGAGVWLAIYLWVAYLKRLPIEERREIDAEMARGRVSSWYKRHHRRHFGDDAFPDTVRVPPRGSRKWNWEKLSQLYEKHCAIALALQGGFSRAWGRVLTEEENVIICSATLCHDFATLEMLRRDLDAAPNPTKANEILALLRETLTTRHDALVAMVERSMGKNVLVFVAGVPDLLTWERQLVASLKPRSPKPNRFFKFFS